MTTGCPFTDPDRLFQDLAVTRAGGGLPYAEPLEARVVSRYDDIVQALHDPQTYSSAPTVPEMPAPWRERFAGRVPSRGTLLGLDNPDHDRLRAAVNTFFMPRRLAWYEPWIREQAHRLIDGFAGHGREDVDRAPCGPSALLSGLEDSARRAGREEQLVVERFAARAAEHEPNRPFQASWPAACRDHRRQWPHRDGVRHVLDLRTGGAVISCVDSPPRRVRP